MKLLHACRPASRPLGLRRLWEGARPGTVALIVAALPATLTLAQGSGTAAVAPRPVVQVIVPLTLDASPAGTTDREAAPAEPAGRRPPPRSGAQPDGGKAWGSADATAADDPPADPGGAGRADKRWTTTARPAAPPPGLRDPLLAPAAARAPAAPAAPASAAPGPADGSGRVTSIIVSGGEATLVAGSRRLRRGDLLDGARIERIDDSGYWLHDGARSRRVDLFPGVRKRIASPAPEPVRPRSPLRPGASR